MPLGETLASYWKKIQGELFPFLQETVGPLTDLHKMRITVLEMVRLEVFVPHGPGLAGRPPAERAALARAFVAKAVFNLPTTRMLVERVQADKTLQRLCGMVTSFRGSQRIDFRMVQVRGGGKVMCHLMFGILVIAALQIVRIVA